MQKTRLYMVLIASFLGAIFVYLGHRAIVHMSSDVVYWELVTADSPNDSKASVMLGLSYRDAGRRADAVGAFGKAIKEDPNNCNARYELASLLLQDGQVNAAQAQFEEIIRLTSSSRSRKSKEWQMKAKMAIQSFIRNKGS